MWDSEFTSIKKDCLVAKLLASNGSIFLRYRGILIILGLYFVKKMLDLQPEASWQYWIH